MTKPASKKGRPRKLTPELETVLFREISEGKTIQDACKAVGVSFQSIAVRRAEDEYFREKLARAYLHGTVFSLDDAEHRLRHSNPKRIAIDREVAHHARWRASRLLPAFSDKLRVTPDVPPVLPGEKFDLLSVARSIGFILTSAEVQKEEQAVQALLPAPAPGSEAAEPAVPSPVSAEEEARRKAEAADDRWEREQARNISYEVEKQTNSYPSAAQSRGPRRWQR